MSFKRQNEPARGIATDLLPGIRRIVAPNRGAMTYHGTNTYLVAHEDQVFVLDPGPDDDSHVAVILAATGGSVAGILLTHSHRDHVGAAPALKAATGAPTYGIPGGQVPPDIEIGEGDSVAGLLVLHTPGHAPDHACFCRPDGVVFSGCHDRRRLAADADRPPHVSPDFRLDDSWRSEGVMFRRPALF